MIPASTEPLQRPTPLPRARRRRALAAAALAAALVVSGCGEDAVSDGEAPGSDGEPPQDPRPQDNEQEAPNAEDADLGGNEEPGIGEDGFDEDTDEQD